MPGGSQTLETKLMGYQLCQPRSKNCIASACHSGTRLTAEDKHSNPVTHVGT